MKIRKKRKGSALITVIVVVSILAITGTTILTVTASDYKMRKIESERIRNLYEADSGLNGVENIIIKASQSAIRKSDEKIKLEFSSLSEDEKTPKKLNEKFKDEFYSYLNQKIQVEVNGAIKEENLLRYLITNKLYIDESNENKLVYEPAEVVEDALIEISEGDYNFSEDGIKIKVKSTFESTEGNLKNKKTVQVTFKIVAPNYNAKVSEVGIYPVFENKTLTVDGNMEVEGGNLNISGDIWVKGNNSKQESLEYAFDKYEGGILLNNTVFNLKGNAYTFNSLNLKDKVENSKVDGEVYANNLYVGKSSRAISSDKNSITITKDLILNNDLALNSTNSEINIKSNFFGINAKSESTENAVKAMNSSSIIVNDTLNTSSITVEKDSYIMGVAYLNATDMLGKKYQTGESVSIKGNYLAYTDPSNLEDGIMLKYYSPLQLLESKNGDTSLKMKADYFVDYYEEPTTNTYKLNQGGVNLKGKVYSVGASIQNNEAKKGNLDGDIGSNTLITEKQRDFALKVLAMNDNSSASDFKSVYDSNNVIRTVKNQIDFNKIKSLLEDLIVNEDRTLLLNEDRTLLLIGEEDRTLLLNVEEGAITIKDNDLNGTKIKKGLIISNGPIIIEGDFDFEGTIMTSGSISIIGSGEKNISYNGELIRDIISENQDVLKEIFITDSSSKKANEIKVVSDTAIYEKSNFLKVTDWKILK